MTKSKRLSRGLAASIMCLLIVGCDRASQSGTVPTPSPEKTTDATSISPPPPPPNSAFIARLSPSQAEQIKAAGLPLILPTDIPSDFTVEEVQIKEGDRFTGYHVLYRNPSDQCFLIEYTSGGIGDIPLTENRTLIESPLLPADTNFGLNHGQYTDLTLRAQFPESLLISDWLTMNVGFYRLAGQAYINAVLSPTDSCQNISVETAKNILESSVLVTEDIGGDGRPSD